jgi:hypothetical protein
MIQTVQYPVKKNKGDFFQYLYNITEQVLTIHYHSKPNSIPNDLPDKR